jgi:hypothetical protein
MLPNKGATNTNFPGGPANGSIPFERTPQGAQNVDLKVKKAKDLYNHHLPGAQKQSASLKGLKAVAQVQKNLQPAGR